jgi:PleD family two-component response regulator
MVSSSARKDILLAEDDSDDLLIFEMALEQTAMPFSLRHARDAKSISKMLGERLPDLLFLDLYLSCDDGFSCLTSLRQNSAYDNIPIIMLTGNGNNKLVEHCYDVGANLYLNKTNELSQLALNLNKVFKIDWDLHRKNRSLDNFILI